MISLNGNKAWGTPVGTGIKSREISTKKPSVEEKNGAKMDGS
jgi:hypothetical protein